MVTLTPQEQEIQLLRIKQDTEFAATPVGQQVKQFEATQRIARLYAQSNFIPDSYRFRGREPLPTEAVIANCTIALEMATRMQANPLMVMQNLYIAENKRRRMDSNGTNVHEPARIRARNEPRHSWQ